MPRDPAVDGPPFPEGFAGLATKRAYEMRLKAAQSARKRYVKGYHSPNQTGFGKEKKRLMQTPSIPKNWQE